MCGRYALFGSISNADLANLVGFEEVDEHGPKMPSLVYPPRWNVAPTQRAPVFRAGADGGPQFDDLRWGLVPPWADDLKFGARCVNARSEEAATKPAFRSAWRSRRCLVPASGFYEWTATRPKQAHYFSRADGATLLLAGLWESSTDKGTGAVVETYAILTRAPYDEVRPVHDRSPLALPADRWAAWLDPSVRDPAAVLDAPPPALRAVRVGEAVGNARNEGPELIVPVAG